MISRQEKAAEARRLKDAGLTWQEAVASMGISRSYYYELLGDPDGVKVAARKRKQGGVCETCGAPTSYGSNGPARHCAAHNPGHAISARIQHERALPRRRRVQQLWAEGKTQGEIAEAVGTTEGTISVLMFTMRREGWDLPYRPDGAARQRAKQAEPRRRRVQQLWAEGKTQGEIAEIIGTTPAAIGTIVDRMRRRGWDFPYRRHPSVQM
jgi:transposase